MKKFLIILGVLVLLLCSAGVYAYFKYLYTEPLSKAELAELTPDWDLATGGDWSPWYDLGNGTKDWNPTRSFNAWLETIPEDDKAWPILIDANLAFSDVLDDKRYKTFADTLPNDPERWAIIEPILKSERAQQLTAAFQEALSNPVLGCVMMNTTDPHSQAAMERYGVEDEYWSENPEVNPSLISSWLPALGVCRGSAAFLCAQAALSLNEDDPDASVELLLSASQAAQLSDEYPTLIGELVRAAINTKVNSTISWALQTHPDRLEERHLQKLKSITSTSTESTRGFYGECLMLHDTMRRLVTPRGTLTHESVLKLTNFVGDDNIPLADPVHMHDQKLGASAQRALLLYKEYLAQGGQKSMLRWQSIVTSDEFLQQVEDELGFIPNLVIGILMPAVEKASTRFIEDEQMMIGIDVAIGAHLHKLRHGEFPMTLDEFDSDLLTLQPIDAFTGKSLSYKLNETGPLVYSVGTDRDDDGGQVRWNINIAGPDDNLVDIRTPKPPEWLRIEKLQQRQADDPDSINGDWVLYPIPIEDPAPLDETEQEIINEP